MVALFLAFKVTSVLSSIMAAPIYIPTSRIGGFPFHHTLSNTYCLYIFKKIYIYFGHVHTTTFIYYVFIFGCSGSSLLHAGSLVVSRGCLQLRCTGFAQRRLVLLWSLDSRVHRLQQLWPRGSLVVVQGPQSAKASVIMAHGLSSSKACEIFPDQRSNPCPLHWQADSYPLCHQGTPACRFFFLIIMAIMISMR